MAALFDGTSGMDDILEILDRMEANCPRPFSTSGKLWELRLRTNVAGHNRSGETMLERGVAMLADNEHMAGWFNQCPVASGIGDSSRHKHSNVDLVQWSAADSRLTLVELKWVQGKRARHSNSPCDAVRQILRYGAAYLFCRRHRERLPVGDRLAMSARHVALWVAAPARYYADGSLRECVSRARESLGGVRRKTGLAMSLDALAFPEWFVGLPFSDGADVRKCCGRPELTTQGRAIVDAFDGLTPVDLDRHRGMG